MLSFYRLKPLFQRTFRACAGDWMTPNLATALGLVFAGAVGLCLVLGLRVNRWCWLAVGPLLIARMACNALDGVLAREKGLADRRGEVLNEITDVGGDGLCYLPVAFFAPPGPLQAMLFAVFVATLLAEFTGVLGKAVTGTRRYEGPLGGKTDRAFWFGLGATLAAIFPSAYPAAVPYFAFVLACVGLTWLNRLRHLWQSA